MSAEEAGDLLSTAHVDDEDATFYYRGFLVICQPEARMRGGWAVRATVVTYEGPHDVVVADSPPDIILISKQAAVDYGSAWGKEWVDANT